MTEDEAKTKWCPFVRDADAGANVSNLDRLPHWSSCIGSQCMAWRPSPPAFKETRETFSAEHAEWLKRPGTYAREISDHIDALQKDGWENDGRQYLFGAALLQGRGRVPCGYCGLAGKP